MVHRSGEVGQIIERGAESFPRVQLHPPLAVEGKHLVWAGIGAFHSRRAGRHSRNGQPVRNSLEAMCISGYRDVAASTYLQ